MLKVTLFQSFPRLLVATLALTSILAVACNDDDSIPVPEPVVLRLNLGGEPRTLDPALATDTQSLDVAGALFVGLTEFNEVTSEIEPNLATRWDISPDGTVYTFHLRDDVEWADG